MTSSHNLKEEPRAVVWDLDGVLVDSAEAHNRSWQALSQRYGLPYDPEVDFRNIFGKHNTDIMNMLWRITDPARVAEMADAKETAFRREATRLRPLPGVVELVRELARRGWKQAIGSSAPVENIRVLLEATGVGPYMRAIASGDDVTAGKPDPQVFLIAFERLGVSPRNGVVIEDAPAGVQAGVSAGAATLGVTTTQSVEALQSAGADRVVNSLADISVDDLEALVRLRQGRT
ncbi:MAG: HAD family phosphatase [Chloroflexota bacterium]|nr:HAD family phosphatase [Chloroflexota bacterium]MDQ5866551.1 HAD family phosphatase [Chloroflexota bacterium]